jgi:hypothetical protein
MSPKLCLEWPLHCVAGVTGTNLKKRIEALMTNRILLRLTLTKQAILAVAGMAAIAAPIVIGFANLPAMRAQSAGAVPSVLSSAVRSLSKVPSIPLSLLAHFLRGAGPRAPASWLAFTSFAGKWYICRHGWIPAYPVNPLWSISVKEQFYIAIPILALYGRRRGLKAVSLALIAVAYVLVINYARQPMAWLQQRVDEQFCSIPVLFCGYVTFALPKGSSSAVACSRSHRRRG